MRPFRNRKEAGELLALELSDLVGKPGVIILALPRGGVPVAHELSTILRIPLDVIVVRKLGVPGHEEFAMGAVATGGVRILNDSLISALGIPMQAISMVEDRELTELRRRESTYRGDRPPADVFGKTVVLVDDGIATGSTMLAAIMAIRSRGAARVVVAAPVAPPEVRKMLLGHADEVRTVISPEDFGGVGRWYSDFSQTTDSEVTSLLRSDHHSPAGKILS